MYGFFYKFKLFVIIGSFLLTSNHLYTQKPSTYLLNYPFIEAVDQLFSTSLSINDSIFEIKVINLKINFVNYIDSIYEIQQLKGNNSNGVFVDPNSFTNITGDNIILIIKNKFNSKVENSKILGVLYGCLEDPYEKWFSDVIFNKDNNNLYIVLALKSSLSFNLCSLKTDIDNTTGNLSDFLNSLEPFNLPPEPSKILSQIQINNVYLNSQIINNIHIFNEKTSFLIRIDFNREYEKQFYLRYSIVNNKWYFLTINENPIE